MITTLYSVSSVIYSAVLLEDTAVGTEFLTINYSDIDIDENAEVIYAIIDNCNETFVIDNLDL